MEKQLIEEQLVEQRGYQPLFLAREFFSQRQNDSRLNFAAHVLAVGEVEQFANAKAEPAGVRLFDALPEIAASTAATDQPRMLPRPCPWCGGRMITVVRRGLRGFSDGLRDDLAPLSV
jgi:hypothetical protein